MGITNLLLFSEIQFTVFSFLIIGKGIMILSTGILDNILKFSWKKLGIDNDPDWPDPDRHAQDADLYRIRQNDADLHPDTDPQYTAQK